MEIGQEIGNQPGIASSLSNLGNIYQSLGNYEKAIDYHSQSMEIGQTIGDKQVVTVSIGNLGNAYHALGDYQKAIDFYSQSIEIKQEIGDKRGIANSLRNLGNTYKSLGAYQKAINCHSKSIEIKQAVGDQQGIANSLDRLCSIYSLTEDYPKMIDVRLQHLKIMQTIGDQADIATSLFDLSTLYQFRGHGRLAMLYRLQAYQIWQDINLPIADAPFSEFTKKIFQREGDTWAAKRIALEKSTAWFYIPLTFILYSITHTLPSPIYYLLKRVWSLMLILLLLFVILLSPLIFLQKILMEIHCGFCLLSGLRSCLRSLGLNDRGDPPNPLNKGEPSRRELGIGMLGRSCDRSFFWEDDHARQKSRQRSPDRSQSLHRESLSHLRRIA